MQPNTGSAAAIYQFLPIIFIFIMFYFFFIRPQSTEQKKRQAMLDGIKKNDEVVTSGGIYGTIVNIKDKTFTLRIDDNVKIEIDKNAVGHVVVKS